jgi:selenocysteine-specific elongation factor
VVLNVRAKPGTSRDHNYRKWLAQRAHIEGDVEACVKSELALRRYGEVPTLLLESHFSAAEIDAAVQRLEKKGELVLAAGFAVDHGAWAEARARTIDLIDRTHRTHPDWQGIEINTVRAALTMFPTGLIEGLIDDLCAGDFVRTVSTIHRRSHQPQFSAGMENVAAEIRNVLQAQPRDPPSRKEIETDDVRRKAVRYLITTGEVTEVSPAVVLSSKAIEEIRRQIIAFINHRGAATVSELRQEIGTSRRVLVPLLEWFDRHGVTRRLGDKRVLARSTQDAKMHDAPQERR